MSFDYDNPNFKPVGESAHSHSHSHSKHQNNNMTQTVPILGPKLRASVRTRRFHKTRDPMYIPRSDIRRECR